jgi:CheY-like chemotaxis protein
MLLCTHNPLMIKDFYGILRDEGFSVAIAEHPASAVRMVLESRKVLREKYVSVIIDSESFGLSAEEAVQIIRNTLPSVPIIVVGHNEHIPDVLNVRMPIDLEEFKQTILDVRRVGTLSRTA